MTDAIRIENLRKTYTVKGSKKRNSTLRPALSASHQTRQEARRGDNENKEALKGVSLSIPQGSIFGLLGPNGAGKSTLINILAGLVKKTDGVVEICGHNIDTHIRAAKQSIGIVPQELVLDTFFTVRQALEITAGYYGVPKAQRKTDEIIHAMGLDDKADAPSRRLSGGMRRRLLVGKALVHSPKVLVLDEPTAGVDVELRRSLWAYVRELNAKGTTVLLTTHYLEEAEELCDRIAIINHGEIIANDTKKALMQGVDSKEIFFTLESPIEAVPHALSAMQARVSAGRLVVKYAPSQSAIDDIFAAVQQAGLDIRDVSTKEVDLEDLFIAMTSDKAA